MARRGGASARGRRRGGRGAKGGQRAARGAAAAAQPASSGANSQALIVSAALAPAPVPASISSQESHEDVDENDPSPSSAVVAVVPSSSGSSSSAVTSLSAVSSAVGESKDARIRREFSTAQRAEDLLDLLHWRDEDSKFRAVQWIQSSAVDLSEVRTYSNEELAGCPIVGVRNILRRYRDYVNESEPSAKRLKMTSGPAAGPLLQPENVHLWKMIKEATRLILGVDQAHKYMYRHLNISGKLRLLQYIKLSLRFSCQNSPGTLLTLDSLTDDNIIAVIKDQDNDSYSNKQAQKKRRANALQLLLPAGAVLPQLAPAETYMLDFPPHHPLRAFLEGQPPVFALQDASNISGQPFRLPAPSSSNPAPDFGDAASAALGSSSAAAGGSQVSPSGSA